VRLAALILVALLLAGCASSPPPASTTTSTPPPTPSPRGPAFGVALSPKSYQGADFAAFFDEAKDLGSVVLWGGPIEQLADEKAAPAVVAQLARQKGLQVAIQTGLFHEGDARAPPMDEATLANHTRAVATFAARYKPEFLVLGVEVNRFAERDPAAFDQYARWYDGAYDAAKNASPDTKVFVTFQYEWMDGKRGGLYGGNASAPDQWSLLDRFPKRDLTGFTTYPGLVLPEPDQAPADWYANISRAGGPIAITETGHFADAPAAGWESSPEEQARFVAWLGARLDALDPALVVWLHAHDQPSGPAVFRHMGLIDEAGQKRPAYDAWRALRSK
jgi:hypothetical protein